MFNGNEVIGLREASAILGVGPRRTATLLQSGFIQGSKLWSGVWITTPAAVRLYADNARMGRGRTMTPATAWGVLWELSGLVPSWLPAATHSRVRDHIRRSNAEELIRADFARTRISYYESRSADRAREGLIRTARAAGASIGIVRNDRYAVNGYVRDGRPNDHATRTGMVPTIGGRHILFTNTLPIDFTGDRMPKAVVAMDLARTTTDDRTRAKALIVLERLQEEWMKQP